MPSSKTNASKTSDDKPRRIFLKIRVEKAGVMRAIPCPEWLTSRLLLAILESPDIRLAITRLEVYRDSQVLPVLSTDPDDLTSIRIKTEAEREPKCP